MNSSNIGCDVIELYEACDCRDLAKVKAILAKNAVVLNKAYDFHGSGTQMTPLHLAVGLESSEIVRLLLEHNADPNSKLGDCGVTPLHLSVQYRYLEIFKLLLNAGGDPEVTDDENGETCIDIIKNMEFDEGMQDFLEAVAFRTNTSFSRKSPGPAENLTSDSPPVLSSFQKVVSSLSTAEGISDQSTYAFFPNATYSMLSPTVVVSSAPRLSLNDSAFLTESDTTSASSAVTEPSHESDRCNSFASSSSSSVAPAPTLTDRQLQAVKMAAEARGFPVLPTPPTSTQGYTMELDLALRNFDYISQWQNLQVEFLQEFKPPKRSSKSFFNYILLDPNVLKRTNFSGNQLRTGLLKNLDKFSVFLKSLFYIGKGTANRPLQHLVEAKARFTTRPKLRLSDNTKLDKVLSIWERGQGIIVLTLFHSATELEANANEACMIDAIGLACPHLTNVRKGSYLNTPAIDWTQKSRNQFGTCLLHKAYCMFVVSGNSVKIFLPQDV